MNSVWLKYSVMKIPMSLQSVWVKLVSTYTLCLFLASLFIDLKRESLSLFNYKKGVLITRGYFKRQNSSIIDKSLITDDHFERELKSLSKLLELLNKIFTV